MGQVYLSAAGGVGPVGQLLESSRISQGAPTDNKGSAVSARSPISGDRVFDSGPNFGEAPWQLLAKACGYVKLNSAGAAIGVGVLEAKDEAGLLLEMGKLGCQLKDGEEVRFFHGLNIPGI